MKTSFMSALALVVAFAATSVFSATVFLDPVNGNDENGGLLETEPVKSFERAKALSNGGIVDLMGSIVVTEDTVFDLNCGTLRRYISSDGTVTNTADLISCNTAGVTLEFSNITVEGIGTDVRISGHLVAAAKANVKLGNNVVLCKSYTSTTGAGVTCANLTMTDNAKITLCRVATPASQAGGAGATVSGLLKMSGFSEICFNSNVCEYGSSVASQRIAGGAYCGSFEMEDNASIHNNRSQAKTYLYGISYGGAGLHVRGATTSIMRGNAKIHNNDAYYQRGGGICCADGTIVMLDSSSVVSNSSIPPNQNVVSAQAMWASALIMSNNATVAYNGLKTTAARYDGGDGAVNVGKLYMHDDALIISNVARTIGGAVVRGGGGMYDRARIAYNTITWKKEYCCSGGLLVSGGEFSMNDDTVIEGHPESPYLYGGVCVNNTGRFILNSGIIRNNSRGILVSAWPSGGYVQINGGQIVSNTAGGIMNGSRAYTGKYASRGVLEVNGGIIADNGGSAFMDCTSCFCTNYFYGGLIKDNTFGGYFSFSGCKNFIGETPCFEDPIKLLYTNVTFYIDGRMRSGAQIPIIFKALNSKSKEIESLTDANSYGLDMKQDGSMEPQIVALPSGRITNAARYSRYFSVANEFSDPTVERYMNDAGEGRMGLSQYRYSGSSLFMVY